MTVSLESSLPDSIPAVGLWVIAVLFAGIFVPGGGLLLTALVGRFGKPLRRSTYRLMYSVGVALVIVNILTIMVTLWVPPIVHYY